MDVQQRIMRTIRVVAFGITLIISSSAHAAVTTFSTDVATSIDNGLAAFAAGGAYNNPSACGDAAGLALLALLEKRVSADPNAVNQGYALATAAHQGFMRTAAANLINTAAFGFYAYRSGQILMALSLYKLSGGPDRGQHADLPNALPYDLCGALDAVFDSAAANQNLSGYWCYYNGGCDDSSTTQFVDAGLASVKAVFSDPSACPDAGRLATLNLLVAKARAGYVANGTTGGPGGVLTADERGHGYNAGNANSIQQTASGLWVQLVGGANLNDPNVQGYLRWLRNRYEFHNNAASGQGWPSFWYAQWALSKALKLITDSGVTPNPGNIGPDDLGTLVDADPPAFPGGRDLHRDPSTDSRVPSFGAGGPGYYAAETPRVYYDQAYTIISQQDVNGGYQDPPGSYGNWEICSRQAYAILVLERSVGGICVDTDQDGVCDSDDNCVQVSNPRTCHGGINDGVQCQNASECPIGTCSQTDTDADGVGDACDCGNNVIDASHHEECDGTEDAACPGACLPPGSPNECTCGGTCGNDTIENGETCDGTSDAACPGACPGPNDPHPCLCPICGDGSVNQTSEQCDGTDAAACAGLLCRADCTCSTCGNNAIDGTEECDGTSDAACPGQCRAPGSPGECSCVVAFCGDNSVNAPGETCDGTDASACASHKCFPPQSPKQCTCDPCGDGHLDPGEQCDDGNAIDGSCRPDRPQQVLDACHNDCTPMQCEDPARIVLGNGIDVIHFHARIEPVLTGGTIEPTNKTKFGIRLTSPNVPGDGTVFSAIASTGLEGGRGRYRYVNHNARKTGGVAKMRILQRSPGSYAVKGLAYGDMSLANAVMTSHVAVGAYEWSVTGNWKRTPSGWVFRQ